MNKNKIETSKRPFILGIIIFVLIKFKQIATNTEKKLMNFNFSNWIKHFEEKLNQMLPKKTLKDNNEIVQRLCDLIKSYSIHDEVWKELFGIVEDHLIPIVNEMKKTTYHDFSGDMYRVLLRYTSGDGKVLGQVLTPKHIANLMIDLAELKRGDSVLDPACGTGIFLVHSMNKLISIADSEEQISSIKSNKIYGIEISKEMFFLTLVNMLINNDGKTNIYVDDNNLDVQKRGIFKYDSKSFKEKPKKVVMNPPYLSHDEIWKFILKALELASEKAVIIIPTSILNKNIDYKREFLEKHSLLSVINMPNNIFYNKSSSGSQVKTSIIIVEINKKNQDNNLGTYFYDLVDDGFISSKKHGRHDGNNKWNQIKDKLLSSYKNRNEQNGISKNVKDLKPDDSWHFHYFNKINKKDFHEINDYLFDLLQSLINKKFKNKKIEGEVYKAELIKNLSIQDIKINEINLFLANDLLIKIETNKYKNALRIEKYNNLGDVAYISAANSNNGSRFDNIRPFYDETVFKDKITWNTQGDGGAGLAFYHPYPFILGSTSFVFDSIKNFNSTERKIFLAYAMSLEKKNRYHGNSITKESFSNGTLTISLPIDAKGDIDFKLIDEFMKNNFIFKQIKKIIQEFKY